MFKEFRARRGETGAEVVEIDTRRAVAEAAHPEIDAELQAHLELKSRMHEALLERLNLSVIDKVEKSELRRQVAALVTQLLEQDGIPLRADAFSKLIDELIFEVMGLGPLEPLLADPTVNDILVNSHQKVYVERFGVLERTPVRFRDESHPWVDARLADGSRVNAIIRPCSVDGPTLSIRKFSKTPYTLDRLIEVGSLTPKAAGILQGLVEARLNVLISGGTGSGKTTLLNAMSSFIDHSQRIVTIEDAAELQLQQEHVVRLETRPSNAEGAGAVTQRDLVRNALRMRPDRIIVGEVRGSECFDMLQAMNTGHDGSMTTVHANTARDALGRLEQMVTMIGADLPAKTIRSQIAAGIQVVVQLNRLSDARRRVMSISEITGMENDVITMQDIFVFRRHGKSETGEILGDYTMTGIRPKFAEALAAAGVDMDPSNFRRDEVTS